MKSIALLLSSLPLFAQWSPIGPFGGAAYAVVADPHSSRTFLAGTRNALLFRSRDAGESWIPIPFPAQLQATLNALVADPQNPGVFFAALLLLLRLFVVCLYLNSPAILSSLIGES